MLSSRASPLRGISKRWNRVNEENTERVQEPGQMVTPSGDEILQRENPGKSAGLQTSEMLDWKSYLLVMSPQRELGWARQKP